jgi:hypothetical protein
MTGETRETPLLKGVPGRDLLGRDVIDTQIMSLIMTEDGSKNGPSTFMTLESLLLK